MVNITTIFLQLKADGERGFQYFRMDIESFTYILGKINTA